MIFGKKDKNAGDPRPVDLDKYNPEIYLGRREAEYSIIRGIAAELVKSIDAILTTEKHNLKVRVALWKIEALIRAIERHNYEIGKIENEQEEERKKAHEGETEK